MDPSAAAGGGVRHHTINIAACVHPFQQQQLLEGGGIKKTSLIVKLQRKHACSFQLQ